MSAADACILHIECAVVKLFDYITSNLFTTSYGHVCLSFSFPVLPSWKRNPGSEGPGYSTCASHENLKFIVARLFRGGDFWNAA